MNPTRICLIRHGETPWNAEGRLQGHTDIDLNPRGLEQAEQVAIALQASQLQVDQLYSSDLKRAQDTAQAIVKKLNTSFITMPELRERNVGALQGLTVAEAPILKPDLWRAHIARTIDHELEGGESILQFARRIENALESIRLNHAGKTVILVSHGGCIDMMYRIATGQALDTPRQVAVPNASLNWLSHNGASWSTERWADTRHLNDPALGNLEL